VKNDNHFAGKNGALALPIAVDLSLDGDDGGVALDALDLVERKATLVLDATKAWQQREDVGLVVSIVGANESERASSGSCYHRTLLNRGQNPKGNASVRRRERLQIRQILADLSL
jgi:hypothetical protein